MKQLLFLCLLALCCGCGPEAPAGDNHVDDTKGESQGAATALNLEIQPGRGFGSFTEETSKRALVKTLKSDNVLDQPFSLGEGEMAPGLLLYPGTKREVEVLLDEDDFPLIYRIQQEDSEWRGPKGVKIGTTLTELAQMNGKPFRLAGFGWDYGGTVTNWNDGAFAYPGFMVVLGLKEDGSDLTEEDIAVIMGDQELKSTLPALERYAIEVVRIEQRY